MDVLRLLFSVNGRIGRLPFFLASLPLWLLSFIAGDVLYAVVASQDLAHLLAGLARYARSPAYLLAFFPFLWVVHALLAKRLRAIGKSGALALYVTFAPLLCAGLIEHSTQQPERQWDLALAWGVNLAVGLNISWILSQLFLQRGIGDVEIADDFLTLESERGDDDPHLARAMAVAAAERRIQSPEPVSRETPPAARAPLKQRSFGRRR